MPRKFLAFTAVIAFVLAAFALPASAGVDDHPAPSRRTITPLPYDGFDVSPTDVAVKLQCAARTGDERATVGCEWRTENHAVRQWQLWNLQLRPERGERNLVAELPGDVSSYADTAVKAPAGYLYAVLGLDGDGNIIARSRVQHVKLAVPDHDVEALRLGCSTHRVETDILSTDAAVDVLPQVSVGCVWSEAHNDAAVGYVLWKSVDSGEREVLTRVGLEVNEFRDHAVSFGHRYTYVVTAVDGAGNVVGLSRPEVVGIPGVDRPIDPRPTDTRPIDTPPTDTRPIDTPPTDTRPIDTPPTDTRPSDVMPSDRTDAARPSLERD